MRPLGKVRYSSLCPPQLTTCPQLIGACKLRWKRVPATKPTYTKPSKVRPRRFFCAFFVVYARVAR